MFTMYKLRTLSPDAEARLGPYQASALDGARRRAHAHRALAADGAPRRAAAAVERRRGRHVARRPAPDPPGVLRAALRGDPAVLAAARRAPGAHRLRPAADGARHVVGGEARPRPRVARRPLRRALPEPDRRDRVAGAAARRGRRAGPATGRRSRDVRDLRHRSPSTAGRSTRRAVRAMADALVHRGPDSEGVFADGPGRARRAAAGDHRPRARRPADAQRGRRRVTVVQNGELYEHRRAAGRPRARAGTAFALALRHRGAAAPATRSAAPTSPRACAGCSPSRSGTRASAGSCSPATRSGSSRSTTASRTACSPSPRS